MADLVPRDPNWEAKVRASFARQSFMDTIGARLTDRQARDAARSSCRSETIFASSTASCTAAS